MDLFVQLLATLGSRRAWYSTQMCTKLQMNLSVQLSDLTKQILVIFAFADILISFTVKGVACVDYSLGTNYNGFREFLGYWVNILLFSVFIILWNPHAIFSNINLQIRGSKAGCLSLSIFAKYVIMMQKNWNIRIIRKLGYRIWKY